MKAKLGAIDRRPERRSWYVRRMSLRKLFPVLILGGGVVTGCGTSSAAATTQAAADKPGPATATDAGAASAKAPADPKGAGTGAAPKGW